MPSHIFHFLPSYKDISKNSESASEANILTSFSNSLTGSKAYIDCPLKKDQEYMEFCGQQAAQSFFENGETDGDPGLSKTEYNNFRTKLERAVYRFEGTNIMRFNTENEKLKDTVTYLFDAYGISYEIYDPEDQEWNWIA